MTVITTNNNRRKYCRPRSYEVGIDTASLLMASKEEVTGGGGAGGPANQENLSKGFYFE